MRRNIFLHFLNRDTREIFDVYGTLSNHKHRELMRRALNAAMVLCEDRCIAPPGFIVEDEIAFELAENQREYLSEGLLQFPMRESNLAEFAEKKRIGYQPMRNRYSGLFSDTRIGFLGANSTGIIGRRSHITEGILEQWQGGPESGHRVWNGAKLILDPAYVDLIAKIPVELNNRGTALTWSAIAPSLPPEAKGAAVHLRDALQHIYFKQYCSEFQLIALVGIPHIIRDFFLPHDDKIYNYRRLSTFLDSFQLRDLILNAPADLIAALRKHTGFISFVDAYAGISAISTTDTDLTFYAGRARDAIRFDWDTFRQRQLSLFDSNQVEIRELASVLGEAAAKLVSEHGLPVRGHSPKQPSLTKRINLRMTDEPELVLFVALQEELDILAQQLNLTKNASPPEASGKLAGINIHVLCPRSMGRVAAAVAMSAYLATRRIPPKLILIVGIAGGIKENGSNVGHIVCVTKVVDLAIRKVVDQSEGPTPNFRREDYRMKESLGNVLRSDLFDRTTWSNDALAFGWPADRRPSIHFGPIASSDEVVSSNEWRTMLIDGPGGETKLLGVEMEAGGVCAAALRWNVHVCMLRTISDNADPSKTDDKWRPLGMKTLASLLEKLPITQLLTLQ